MIPASTSRGGHYSGFMSGDNFKVASGKSKFYLLILGRAYDVLTTLLSTVMQKFPSYSSRQASVFYEDSTVV
jgi:hypothetical protein